MEQKAQRKKLRRLVWIGSGVSIVAIAVAVVASWFLYQNTVTLLTQNLRERLLSISITEASNISAANVNALQTEQDWKKPQWADVVNRLHAAKIANKDIVYMYIFRKDPSDPMKMDYVADAGSINPYANAENDPSGAVIDASACPKCVDANNDGKIDPSGADYLQWPGQEYVDPPEGTLRAYNGPTTAKDLYTDSYGSVLTGYAPIYNDDGTIAAILATDIRANDFFTITRQTLYPFLIFIGFLIAIISVLAIILIYLWERQAEALAELDRLKNEFLSVAAHQLRAPLTAIRGYAANIIENTYGEVPSFLNEPMWAIQESARLMVNSIEDYLNISRIDQGRMKYDMSKFDVVDLVRKTAAEFQIVAKQRGLVVRFEETAPVMINADVGKVKQIITNLTDNAIKYTKHGGIGLIVEKRPSTVRISVRDTGVGIAPEDIGKLFSKFTRTRDANKTNTTGTGLGLYVAKELAEGNGGKVWVESPGVGKGSTFIVEFPAV